MQYKKLKITVFLGIQPPQNKLRHKKSKGAYIPRDTVIENMDLLLIFEIKIYRIFNELINKLKCKIFNIKFKYIFQFSTIYIK